MTPRERDATDGLPALAAARLRGGVDLHVRAGIEHAVALEGELARPRPADLLQRADLTRPGQRERHRGALEDRGLEVKLGHQRELPRDQRRRPVARRRIVFIGGPGGRRDAYTRQQHNRRHGSSERCSDHGASARHTIGTVVQGAMSVNGCKLVSGPTNCLAQTIRSTHQKMNLVGR